ncbi:acetoacetate--CoA ligase [Viridibacterium curvum]|uniref:Acetoacetate--CoA ligase n=2 Tax=Viridibacterium curvum TaxID=1101404 RepID=A0ABP9QBZ5_9RHOO
MAAFMQGMGCTDYAALHAVSIREQERFWRAVWDLGGVIGEPGELALQGADTMLGARWFPEARLNFAENLLRGNDSPGANPDALVFRSEDKIARRLSRVELRQQVARMAAAFRTCGLQPGDRVAAYLPNVPETIIAMLAAASLGAVFSSASPDFGVQGVLDRFGQIEPVVLLACDGYWYNGKRIDVQPRLADILAGLPSVRCMVLVPCLGDALTVSTESTLTLDEFLAPHHRAQEPDFLRLPFDHPLYIMYSSGTTGVPKCIVHGAGGTLLQHLKEHRLHSDLHEGDRLFYYTTCGWMMWNWLATGLASGATLMLYDGSPFLHHGRVLWEYAEAERFTHFGTSAKYIDALAKIHLKPREHFGLSAMRVLMSTGSPLLPESFDFIHRDISPTVQIASISGGTDIVSCFVLGNPALPVWRGEIQCAGLGMAVEVWDEEGQAISGQKGELVCTRPFPSMPVGFWNDADGSRYRAAYFERFPGVWCHGDYCERTLHDGFVIHGRSDATLNPGGVRIGTAEIYRQVEKLDEVQESIVVGQDWQGDVRVVLFVRLREGLSLDATLEARIRQTIRDNTTPRHVPAKILQVADIPRTRSGKIVELAVRRVLHGEPVKNVEALANPEALALFRERVELRD